MRVCSYREEIQPLIRLSAFSKQTTAAIVQEITVFESPLKRPTHRTASPNIRLLEGGGRTGGEDPPPPAQRASTGKQTGGAAANPSHRGTSPFAIPFP